MLGYRHGGKGGKEGGKKGGERKRTEGREGRRHIDRQTKQM